MLGMLSSALNDWRAGNIAGYGSAKSLEPAIRPVVNGFANRVGSIQRGFDLISNTTGLPNPMHRVPTSARDVSGNPSGGSGSAAPSAKSLDYLNADLARHYGMSAETAYSEALSNTAYQRAVKDMQAAGLNPAVLFGAGRASTADGVSYIKSASGGSSGGSGRHYGAGSSAKLFSEGAYGAISTAVGLGFMAATKSPTGFWIGSQTAKGIMGALNALTK